MQAATTAKLWDRHVVTKTLLEVITGSLTAPLDLTSNGQSQGCSYFNSENLREELSQGILPSH